VTLRIVAAGMASCLGDLRTGCAAQRAGLSRVTPISDELGLDGEANGEPLLGSPIRGLTDGFVQTGRWLRLALAALADLRRGASSPALMDAAAFGGTPLLWSLPLVTVNRFGWSDEEASELLRPGCLELLAHLSELPFALDQSQVFCGGHSALALSLEVAWQRLEARAAQSVLLISTDSWLDQMGLMALLADERLKTGQQPLGFRPGEAGVCLLVEADRGQRSALAPLATIRSMAVGSRCLEEAEPPTARRVESAPALGRALADVIRRCVARDLAQLPFCGDVVVDLNGEPWRAMALGHAQVLLNDIIDWEAAQVVVPATSFADVGAASAGIGTCLAIRAHARGYASTDQTLVCSLSDAGQASAFLVQRP
jgi:3-oxoacyl-[acyl-carrier-protein] synthase I